MMIMSCIEWRKYTDRALIYFPMRITCPSNTRRFYFYFKVAVTTVIKLDSSIPELQNWWRPNKIEMMVDVMADTAFDING